MIFVFCLIYTIFDIFNIVSHSLLAKLWNIGLKSVRISRVQSYLSGRIQWPCGSENKSSDVSRGVS